MQYYIIRNLKERLTWSVRGTLRSESAKLDGIGNTLSSLNNFGQNRSTQRYYDGADPDNIWAVRSAGIDPATGRELFIKKDGSYTYDFTYDDEVIVGNTRPDAEGTFGTNFGYRGLTFSAILRYRIGADAFNTSVFNKVENISSSSLSSNQDKRALYDRWQKPGDVAQFKDIKDASLTTLPTSRFVQDNSFLRLNALTLTYDFNREWLKRNLGLRMLRLEASTSDLINWNTVRQERGLSYPKSYKFNFSVKAQF